VLKKCRRGEKRADGWRKNFCEVVGSFTWGETRLDDMIQSKPRLLRK
jgi:hypothetical protein